MTDERLAEIKARAKMAKLGPWQVDSEENDILAADESLVAELLLNNTNPYFDAMFIAHARQDIPDLIAEIERLRAELRKRCDYLEERQWEERSLWGYRANCIECGYYDPNHAPDCRHARLMNMPEGV